MTVSTYTAQNIKLWNISFEQEIRKPLWTKTINFKFNGICSSGKFSAKIERTCPCTVIHTIIVQRSTGEISKHHVCKIYLAYLDVKWGNFLDSLFFEQETRKILWTQQSSLMSSILVSLTFNHSPIANTLVNMSNDSISNIANLQAYFPLVWILTASPMMHALLMVRFSIVYCI